MQITKMMKKTNLRTRGWLLAAALLLAAVVPATAKVPDEEDIAVQILDAESEYYYPNLMMRFRQGDLTLSDEAYHYLYYGYPYQEGYRPLEPNPAMDKVLLFASELDPDHPGVEQVHRLLAAVEEALQRDPFSPQLLNLKAYAYGALGDSERERTAYEQMRHIMMTIEDSGDGLTKETPCHIIMFDHALSLLASYGLETERARIISREVEYIPLVTPRLLIGKKVKGYYFDYGRIYRNKPEGYVFKRDRTWQFNNLPPRTYK